MQNRDVILGGGEVGYTLFAIMNKSNATELISIIDANPDKQANSDLKNPVDILHICIPYTDDFSNVVAEYDQKMNPNIIIIHSTMPVGTSEHLQKSTKTPIVTSPTRGVHSKFVEDMLAYPKWIAFNGIENDRIKDKIDSRFQKMNINLVWKKDGKHCEKAKLYCDTTYYGVLIAYRKTVDEICNDDDIWEYAKEIHDRLGNRPVMYNDRERIGGHCVIQNLKLLIPDYLSNYIRRWINKYG